MTPSHVRTQTDLEQLWRQLMEPLGFSRTTLWFLLVGADDQPLPQVNEIVDLPDLPDTEGLGRMAEMLRTLLDDVEPGGRFAFLRTRPGRGGLDAADRAWATGLYAACRDAGVPLEVVHAATDELLLPVPMDEVVRLPFGA